MASFSNPPRVLLHLLLLIFSPPFLPQAPNLAAADYKLLQAECHNSETPETCMSCLKSSPAAEKADREGIAAIVVNCTFNQAGTLVANMTSLASKASDQKKKSTYQNCARGYSIAKNDLTTAKQALQNHKYDDAEESVAEAIKFDYDCQDAISSYQVEVPSDVVFEVRVYQELYEAACRIIEKLQ